MTASEREAFFAKHMGQAHRSGVMDRLNQAARQLKRAKALNLLARGYSDDFTAALCGTTPLKLFLFLHYDH